MSLKQLLRSAKKNRVIPVHLNGRRRIPLKNQQLLNQQIKRLQSKTNQLVRQTRMQKIQIQGKNKQQPSKHK